MNRFIAALTLAVAVAPGAAQAEMREVRQVIFGMD
jgi:hypothetical protein